MDILHETNFNVRLVKTIKKYPILYNTDHKEYTNREARETAWIEVGEELRCDPKILQKKFQNFRTILVRKLKQVHNRESVNRNYYLYPYIKYLIPFLKSPYNTVSLEKKSSKNDTSSEDEAHAPYKYEPYSDHSMEEDHIIEESDGCENPIYYEEYVDAVDISLSKEIKRSHTSDEDKFADDEQLNEITEISKLNQKRPKLTTSYASSSTAVHSKPKHLDLDADEEERSTNFKQEHTEKSVNSILSNELSKITSSHTSTISANRSKRKIHLQVSDTSDPTKQFLLSLLPDLGEMTNAQLRHFKSKVLLLVEDILKDNAA